MLFLNGQDFKVELIPLHPEDYTNLTSPEQRWKAGVVLDGHLWRKMKTQHMARGAGSRHPRLGMRYGSNLLTWCAGNTSLTLKSYPDDLQIEFPACKHRRGWRGPSWQNDFYPECPGYETSSFLTIHDEENVFRWYSVCCPSSESTCRRGLSRQ